MPPETFYYLMAATVALSTFALLVQAFAGYKAYRAIMDLRARIEPLVPQTQAALQSINHMVSQSTRQLGEVSGKTTEVLDLARAQLAHFDQTREEVTARVKSQIERVELVLDDTISRVQDVVGVFHRGVMKPVREVSGVMAGIRAGVSTLRQGGRPSVADVTHDEEMFI
jgi:hypothetical protein